MKTIALSDLETLAVGLFALLLATAISRRVPLLARLNVPVAVIGGVLAAVLVALLYRLGGTTVQFATQLTDFLLLVFFTTVGLSAKFSALKAGGRPLVILCIVTLILLVAQNVVGVVLAWSTGAHPFYGLLIGSVSFVGGPGTAAAWAKEAQAMGLARAPEIAVAAATLAVVVGAIVSGPITGWLIERRKLHGPAGPSPASWVAPEAAKATPAPPIATVMLSMLLIVVAVLVGAAVNAWARERALSCPAS